MSTSKLTVIAIPEELFEQEQADSLRSSIEHFHLNGSTNVELDFSNCKMASAYALNAIALASANIGTTGGKLTITRLNPVVREIMEHVAFDLLVPFSKDPAK